MKLNKLLGKMNFAMLRENYVAARKLKADILNNLYKGSRVETKIEIELACSRLSYKTNDFSDAKIWSKQAYDKLHLLKDKDFTLRSDILFCFGITQYKLGNYNDAEKLLNEAAYIYSKINGLCSESMIFTIVHLAEVRLLKNDGPGFEDIIEDAMKSFTKFLMNNFQNMSSTERFCLMQRFYPSYVQLMGMIASDYESPTFIKAALDFRLNTKSLLLENNLNTEYSENAFESLRGILKPDEVIIEILRQVEVGSANADKIKYIFFIISADSLNSPHLLKMEISAESEGEWLNIYQKNIKTGAVDFNSYDTLWRRIDELLKRFTTIYFSPDGIYRHINIQTLQNDENEYLGEKYNILYCSDVRNIRFISSDKLGLPNKALICTNPIYYSTKLLELEKSIEKFLPGLQCTQMEAENISEQLSGENIETTVYTGESITKQIFTDLEAYGLIHIASHGYLKKTPLLTKNIQEMLQSSGIFLSHPFIVDGVNEIRFNQDGYLSVDDVRYLKFEDLQLVVLSACYSGQGLFINLGEYFGIQHAFFCAGAKYVISTLWEVGDKFALEFMNSFYRNWLSLKDIQGAFHQTQKEMKIKYVHPNKWASFVLYHR